MQAAVENESLVLDLLEWVGAEPRTYRDVMLAWKTSCPRLTIWEDAVDAGYLAVSGQQVCVTTRGIELLDTQRPENRRVIGPVSIGG